jgi:hypothetical protein
VKGLANNDFVDFIVHDKLLQPAEIGIETFPFERGPDLRGEEQSVADCDADPLVSDVQSHDAHDFHDTTAPPAGYTGKHSA